MVVGSYLLCSTQLRIFDDLGKQKFFCPPNVPSLSHGRLVPKTLKERVKLVLNMAPKRMKTLVVINSDLTTFELIHACVEAAENYADNVIVIPSLLALLTYALEDISKFRNPPPKEVVMVITITSEFVDFVILNRKDQNSKLCVAKFEHFEDLSKSKSIFPKIYNYWYPHSTVILVQESMQKIATEIKKQFNPDNCFIKPFIKWDYILLHGGLFWAMSDEHGFDTRYHIANFSSGYETCILNRKYQTHERHILLPQRSALPCNINGFNGIGQLINISYSPEYYQSGGQLISQKKPAIKHTVYAAGKSNEILGIVDERGVPYVKDSIAFKNLVLSKEANLEKKDLVKVDIIKSYASTSGIFSQPTISSLNNPPEINFLFCDNLCGIEVAENGFWKMLKGSSGTEWTPLYLSMAHGTVEIGENAKTDFKMFPKHVIYDVFKIIGKLLDEIKVDPKWGFKLTENDEIVHFQIETISGPRLLPQEIIIAAFLKSMKLQTESILNVHIKEIRFSTNFKLNEIQKAIIEKAAVKNNLKILSFNIRNLE
uniref:Uncharacterized protein n=1 Tax=Panagrolaimus sp. PS1159 TaxID=55785 RepID=A0AC35G4P6_9BILA